MSRSKKFSHFDASGQAHMVDVGEKPETRRIARATGSIRMAPATLKLIQAGGAKKGDVLGVARIAAIQAAKRTSDLIPLCHPLPLSNVELTLEVTVAGVEVTAVAEATAQTGVEMEALTAVSVAALTVYDMAKAIDKAMSVTDITLVEKTKEPV